jgi:hypothetical protein
MRSAILAISAALLVPAASGVSQAHPYRDGIVSVGIGLADPSALDIKFWTDYRHGFDMGIGLENFDDQLGIYGEFEFGIADFALGNDGGRGLFYLGPGLAVGFRDNNRTSLAATIPIGLDFRFAPPVDLFIEARPGIGVSNHPAFGIGGQIGVRARF